MTANLGGDGTLTMTVWPVYIGLCNANLGTPPFIMAAEPIDDPRYQRGQITWEYRDGRVVGRARIHCPAGEYTHYLYYQHPTDQALTGIARMPHDIRLTYETNIVDVDPIINEDLSDWKVLQ